MSEQVGGPHVRVLVAGVGNVFFGDDGFGPEVARVLAQTPVAGAKVEDFGIRGLHLSYELLNGYEHAIIVDAVPRGDVPGTLYVIEPDATVVPATPDAHRMDLGNVFAYLRVLGGEPPPITIVGCEPENIEPGMGLSPVVARSVDGAAALVRRLVDQVHSQVRVSTQHSHVRVSIQHSQENVSKQHPQARVATQPLAAQARETTGGSTWSKQ